MPYFPVSTQYPDIILNNLQTYTRHMCGIFGIITREQATLGPTLIEAGRMLSYRGYDSVGCATIHHTGEIDLRKDVGKVDVVAEKQVQPLTVLHQN